MAAMRFGFIIRNISTNRTNLAFRPNPLEGKYLVEEVVSSSDGKMKVAWHPDIDFPYELTQPIPEEAITDTGSLLKEKALNTAMEAFRNKHPEVARQELMNLTHTTKHRWFPRARDKRAKKTPMDRKYL